VRTRFLLTVLLVSALFPLGGCDSAPTVSSVGTVPMTVGAQYTIGPSSEATTSVAPTAFALADTNGFNGSFQITGSGVDGCRFKLLVFRDYEQVPVAFDGLSRKTHETIACPTGLAVHDLHVPFDEEGTHQLLSLLVWLPIGEGSGPGIEETPFLFSAQRSVVQVVKPIPTVPFRLLPADPVTPSVDATRVVIRALDLPTEELWSGGAYAQGRVPRLCVEVDHSAAGTQSVAVLILWDDEQIPATQTGAAAIIELPPGRAALLPIQLPRTMRPGMHSVQAFVVFKPFADSLSVEEAVGSVYASQRVKMRVGL
jgi:hypothetical protein